MSSDKEPSRAARERKHKYTLSDFFLDFGLEIICTLVFGL